MAKIAPLGKYRGLDLSGNPLAGGLLYTYEAGTSTPKATYTTSAGDVANANPVVLDANGYADVWLDSGAYKFVLKDSSGVTQFTTDNISGAGNGAYGFAIVEQATNLNLTTVYKNYLIDCTASLTITLPAAATAGEGFVFIVKNTSSGDVTIDPDGAELIDGSATLVIPKGMSANIVCTGTAWKSFSLPTVGATNDNTFSGVNSFTSKVKTPDAGELTIASGAITVTGVYHTVDTEADAASDDLDTINGGADGQLLILRQEDNARDVTLTNAGNIVTPQARSIVIRDTSDVVTLIYDGALAKWVVQSSFVIDASTDAPGIVEKATSAEVTAETADKFPDSADLKYHEGIIKAWARITVSGGVPSISDSYNLTSITDRAAGQYTLNWSITMANANYAVLCGNSVDLGTAAYIVGVDTDVGLTTTTTPIAILTQAGSNADAPEFSVAIIGDI